MSLKILSLLLVFIACSHVLNGMDQDCALFQAIEKGDLEKVRQLCEHNKDLVNCSYNNIYLAKHDTPLACAAWHSQWPIVTYLLEQGADVNTQGARGEALYYACYERNYDAVVVLFQYNADVKIANNEGTTPLHWIMLNNEFSENQVLIMKKLLTKMDPNVQDNRGNTLLHYCMYTYNAAKFYELSRVMGKKLINILLFHGARINIKNNDGETPLDLARRLDACHNIFTAAYDIADHMKYDQDRFIAFLTNFLQRCTRLPKDVAQYIVAIR